MAKINCPFISIVKVVFVLCVRGGGGVIIFHREEFTLPLQLRPDGFRNLVVITTNYYSMSACWK